MPIDFRHNAAGQLVEVTFDGHPNTLLITYDQLGRRTQVADPDRGVVDYLDYDANGNLTQQDGPAASDVVTWTYDALDRPLTRAGNTGIGVTWTYDQAIPNGIGRLTLAQPAGGARPTTIESYHPLGAIEAKRNGQHVFSAEFNWLGDITHQTFPTGTKISWARDARGYVTAVSDADGDYATDIKWDSLLRLSEWTAGNGTPTKVILEGGGSNPFTGRAQRIEIGSGGSLLALDYAYQTNDFVAVITDSWAANRLYGYDNVGRLVGSHGPYGVGLAPEWSFYAYDSLGNITCFDSPTDIASVGCTGETYAYGGSRPHAPNLIGGQAVQYDDAGNLDGLGTREYDFDPLGRLVSVKESGSVIAGYSYHAEGELAKLVYSPTGGSSYTVERLDPSFDYHATDQEGHIHVVLGDQTIATRRILNYNPNSGGCAGASPGVPGSGNPWSVFLPCVLLALVAVARRFRSDCWLARDSTASRSRRYRAAPPSHLRIPGCSCLGGRAVCRSSTGEHTLLSLGSPRQYDCHHFFGPKPGREKLLPSIWGRGHRWRSNGARGLRLYWAEVRERGGDLRLRSALVRSRARPVPAAGLRRA